MSKKKSIISYEKLTIDQKKQLLIAFPDGFEGNTSKMTNPITGDVFESLFWETEEIIYLVKLPKLRVKAPSVEEDEDDDFEDDIDAVDSKDEDDSMDDEEEDEYDKPEVDEDEEDED